MDKAYKQLGISHTQSKVGILYCYKINSLEGVFQVQTTITPIFMYKNLSTSQYLRYSSLLVKSAQLKNHFPVSQPKICVVGTQKIYLILESSLIWVQIICSVDYQIKLADGQQTTIAVDGRKRVN